MRIGRALLVLLLVFGTLPAQGEPPAASPWATGNRIVLAVTEGSAGKAKFIFEVAANGEFRVDVTESGEAGVSGRSGTVLMIAGRAMATQGVDLPMGSEIAAVDRPTLELQLVRALLDRAIPGGPAAVREPVPVEIKETSQPLLVSTLSASSDYRPPWSVAGSVRREAAERLAFDLTLHATAENPGSPGREVHLAGTWELGTPLPHLPDDLPLAGWNTYTLGPIHRTIGRTEIFDYGAVPVSNRFSSVGAFRKAVEADTPIQ